jgi:hypothetical protein
VPSEEGGTSTEFRLCPWSGKTTIMPTTGARLLGITVPNFAPVPAADTAAIRPGIVSSVAATEWHGVRAALTCRFTAAACRNGSARPHGPSRRGDHRCGGTGGGFGGGSGGPDGPMECPTTATGFASKYLGSLAAKRVMRGVLSGVAQSLAMTTLFISGRLPPRLKSDIRLGSNSVRSRCEPWSASRSTKSPTRAFPVCGDRENREHERLIVWNRHGASLEIVATPTL